MSSDEGHFSPSGVWVAEDFRSNLTIDRYDPIFADMRASKLKHLRSVNSEDAITWNVFRSLRQIDPLAWLPTLWGEAFKTIELPPDPRSSVVRLWESIEPPLGLLATGDEGASEIDVIIEGASWVWFIEAKFRSDISRGTTVRPERDQILRNLDVGTHYAGVRRFFFSLLIASEERSPLGIEKVEEYKNIEVVREKLLAHRCDRLLNLQAISQLLWSQMAKTLDVAAMNASREDERCFAKRAWEWMHEKTLT